MRILVATRNRHKLEEIRAILRAPDVELVGLDQVAAMPEVEEDGDTFEANAIKKAVTLARVAGMWTLADDSGLEVDALGGEPGIRSARYAGEPVDYEANNRKLLRALSGVTNRSARFRCVIALAAPDGRVQTVDGRCEGVIAEAGRGRAGFGYDPIFVPRGYPETFAELAGGIKNRISHRGQALALARARWFDGATEF